MTTRWTLRPATAADLPFLLALRLATMTPQFARQGITLSDAEHRLRAEFRLDAACVVEVDDQPAGVLKLLQDGGAWTVEQFQVAPGHQGRGLGAAILGQVIADARAAGAPLRLSVLKQNPARHLYVRLGFVTAAESTDSFEMTWVDPAADTCDPDLASRPA